MGNNTVKQVQVSKKPKTLDEVDLEEHDYGDNTPVQMSLGKLRLLLHDHVDLGGNFNYNEFMDSFR